MKINTYNLKKYRAFIDLAIFLVILSFIGYYNFIFFHGLADTFSLIVATSIFMVAWNARQYITNHYFLFIGLSYLFVGFLNLLHVFSYEDFGIFKDISADTSDQLWVASLYLVGFSFLIAPFFIKVKIRPRTFFLAYALITYLIVHSIFYWNTFPQLDSGDAPTPFKVITQYFIVFLFLASLALLYRKRKAFDTKVLYYLFLFLGSLVIGSEMILLENTDSFNYYSLIGHLITVVSSYFFYLAIVESSLMRPYTLLFKNLKDKEAALRESEELYRSLVECDLDAIVVHDTNGIMYVNPAGVDLFGAKDASELKNKKLRDFIHPDYINFFKSKLIDLNKGLKRIPLREAKIIRLDGRTMNVEISGRVMNRNGGLAVQSTIRDLSNRKIAIEDAPDHIVITNQAGKIIYANKAAEKMTGYSWEEMAGHKPSLWGNFLENGGVDKNGLKCLCRSVWESINENNPNFMGEVVNTRKSGEKYIADLHISPVYDDNQTLVFFVAIERDITQLKEIDKAKTEFLSLASHELRTPLASISLSSELLLRGTGGQTDPKQEKFLKEIYYSTHRMSELISTFLNVSRIEMDTFIVENAKLDITKELEETISQFERKLKDKEINLKTFLDNNMPPVNFDRNILKIIMENLLGNAIRYTPQKGLITIEARMNDSLILIKVKDTGCGVPLSQQHKIFTKSFRADNAREMSSEGLGLGLYIVKSISEKAGSKVWFESIIGEGATFYVSIPVI